jgi:hypothetical protein
VRQSLKNTKDKLNYEEINEIDKSLAKLKYREDSNK